MSLILWVLPGKWQQISVQKSDRSFFFVQYFSVFKSHFFPLSFNKSINRLDERNIYMLEKKNFFFFDILTFTQLKEYICERLNQVFFTVLLIRN